MKKFDALTNAMSTPGPGGGYTRNIARLKCQEFEREVGSELCNAMFDYLVKRDKKRGG